MEPTTYLSGFGWIVIVALILGVRLAIERGKKNAEERESARQANLPPTLEMQQELPPLRWLEGEDSPTGSRVLDCRAYALGFQFVTSDKETQATFAKLRQSDGSELSGKTPDESWLVAVDWEYEFEEAEMIAGGMRAQSTEDLWMIDFRDDRLYFRRSWTGQIVFMTNFRRVPTAGAQITRIWVTGEEPFGKQSSDYIAAYVGHLIDTHLLGVLTPFPIPPDFPHDDKKIAAFVFHSVGRRGWLAEYFSGAMHDDNEPFSV
ncbi:MAG: hypothetical protein AB1752_13765 [Candidatus Zixiibacteriota bacterium]